MAFKMKGSPAKMGMISGTAGHRSALKQVEEASALKQAEEASPAKGIMDHVKKVLTNVKTKVHEATAPDEKTKTKKDDTKTKTKTKKDPYAEAKKKDPNLDKYIKERNKHKPGSEAYEAQQALINKAYGKTRSQKLKKAQIAAQTKADATSGDSGGQTKIDAKYSKKTAEIQENLKKAKTGEARKAAKDKYGKGSKEFLEAKMADLKAREEDRQGAGGGGKQWGIFRGISSWGNKRKQARTQKELDAIAGAEAREKAKTSPATKRKKY
jgi:hypothetical protein